MARFVKPSTLSLLLLGFLLDGCATANKNTTTDVNTAAATNASANTNALADKPITESAASMADPAASTAPSTAVDSVPEANIDRASDNNRKEGLESFDGPVFKNAAPPATYPPYSKEDPWEPMN